MKNRTVVLICASILCSLMFFPINAMSPERCENGYFKPNTFNMFFSYPLMFGYFNYNCIADNNIWVAVTGDILLLASIAEMRINYIEGEKITNLYLLGSVTTVVVYPYITLLAGLISNNSGQIIRAGIGIAVPLLVFVTGAWNLSNCVQNDGEQKKTEDVSLLPIFTPEYSGLSFAYRF